jgi:hypothetical protein
MNYKIYCKLIELARDQSLISYDELNKDLDLGLNFDLPSDRVLIGRWLKEISEDEVKSGHHMLSALVVHRNKDGQCDPGKGFFDLARSLNIYSGDDDQDFWAKEVTWLHEYWRTHSSPGPG